MGLNLFAQAEDVVDFAKTAALANEAFAGSGVVFTSEGLRWLYKGSYGCGSTVIALRHGAEKVGQIALLKQDVMVDGRREAAALFADLFIAKPYRGRASLTMLFDEAGRQAERQNIRFVFGMANASAVGINTHFFKMSDFARLPLYTGFALPWHSAAGVTSLPFTPETDAECHALFAAHATPTHENGVPWTADRLAERLRGKHSYALHALGGVLLISSRRRSRGLAYTMLCGFFPAPDATPTPATLRKLAVAACRWWRVPLHVYVGFNARMGAPPGLKLPLWLRPSPLMIQLRDFHPERPALNLDRYQLLDFDLG